MSVNYRTGDTVALIVSLRASGVPATGRTITLWLLKPDNTVVTTLAAAEMARPGKYRYTGIVGAGDFTQTGSYVFGVQSVSGGPVDNLYVENEFTVNVGGVSTLDAAISTRLAASDYTAPANADIATLLGRLTDVRAGYLDVSISSRLAAATYTAPLSEAETQTTVRAGLTAQGYTTLRAVLLDALDAAVTSRLAASAYIAPPVENIDAIKAQTDRFQFDANDLVLSSGTDTGGGLTPEQDARLIDIQAHTSLIRSDRIRVEPAVDPFTKTLKIRQGNSYGIAGGKGAVLLAVEQDYSAYTLKFRARLQNAPSATVYETDVEALNATTLSVVMSSSFTRRLSMGRYDYEVKATLGNAVDDIYAGVLVVESDVR